MNPRKASLTFSAVVPMYNAELYIQETLESLCSQTYPLEEIIVVDDACQDQSAQIVAKWMEQTSIPIKVIRNDRNRGVSYSRNKGFGEASGQWILLLDADDVVDQTLVETHVQLLATNEATHAVLCHSAYRQIDEHGNLLPGITQFKQVGPHEILGYEFVRNHVYLSGTSVHRQTAIEAGLFDLELSHSEDWDLWLRLAQRGGFLYINEPLFTVRRHSSNASSHIKSMLDGERRVLQKYRLEFIKEAIHRRDLPIVINAADYVSVLYRLDQYEEGHHYLKQLIAEGHSSASLYFFHGLYFVICKQFRQAATSFREALKQDKHHGAARNNLAAAWGCMGHKEEAIQLLQEVLSDIPNYMDANHNLTQIQSNPHVTSSDLKWTWRELRPVLLQYSG
ncbi:glycosyltransferase [Marinicrinis lubricantis]|uniref:Glycosyltransferase n=1 Tax=Marinicrinis lubricantis TaxID=2086470 RepID=A0ABW1ISZ0_9BACL